MVNLTIKDLLKEPTRLVLVVMGLTVSLLMVLVGIGMLTGIIEESQQFTKKSEYDLFIIEGNRDNLMEGGHVSDAIYNRTIALRGVKDVDKIIYDYIGLKFGNDDTSAVIIGYDISSDYLEPWDVTKGDKDDLKKDNTVIVSEQIKRYFPEIRADDKLKAGSPEESLRVKGFCANSKSFNNPIIWTNYETAKRLLHVGNESTYLGVKLESGYSLNELEKDLDVFKDYITLVSSERMEERISDYILFEMGMAQTIGILAILGFIVSMIIISITLYQSVMDKIRELVSLKALGAKKSFINKLIISQTFIIVTAGFILATLIALITTPIISSFSTIPVNVNPFWALFTYVVSLGLGVFCSLFSIRKVHKTDPAIIFRA